MTSQSGIDETGTLLNTTYPDWNERLYELPDVNKYVFSLYLKSGVYANYMRYRPLVYDAEAGRWIREESIGDWYAMLQNPKRWLPEWAGLPFARLERRISRLRTTESAQSTDQELVNTIGSDDIILRETFENMSFRVAAQYRISPIPTFTYLEASGKWQVNDFIEIGARTYINNAFNKAGIATEEYISIGVWNKAKWSFSHSYNSPDNTTFVPLRGIHVYGFQVIYGVSNLIKPLIPMIQALRSDEE